MIILKNEEQINGIRKSCKYVAQLFEELKSVIKPGISTKEIDTYCLKFMKKIGGKSAWPSEGFPASTCISVNEEVIHGVPSLKKIIQDGDLVSVDIGINLDGYISDSCVTFPVGNVSDENLKLLKITTDCLYAGIDACKAGERLSAISHAVFNLANKNGYGVVRDFCGHGVGLQVHEEPNIFNYPNPFGKNPRIKPGMVLAIEPMINLGTENVSIKKDGWTVVTDDKKPSCHMEHTVAVFDDHTEILTTLD
ncbi:MAG: type I methionyl aminopeptidase [Treponema sp.]|nr:MAG: type I methionyl aminopeptidase [Treponema sp.]